MTNIRVYVTEEEIFITDEENKSLTERGFVRACYEKPGYVYLEPTKKPIPVGSWITLQRQDGTFSDAEEPLRVKRYETLSKDKFLAVVARHAEKQNSLKTKFLDLFGFAETLEDAVLKEINQSS